MKLNEYLAKNAVKLMIKGSGEKNPTRQTNDLGMYDYVENLESVLGKMVWICDYRANADPTKKPIRNIKPTPVLLPVIGAARCLLPAPFQETKYPVF